VFGTLSSFCSLYGGARSRRWRSWAAVMVDFEDHSYAYAIGKTRELTTGNGCDPINTFSGISLYSLGDLELVDVLQK